MTPTWTFTRAEQRLVVQRRETDGGLQLVLLVAGEQPRTYCFRNPEALQTFQDDMERFLLETGWRFATFVPERRTYRDRRGFPRITNDRRRWWTDSQPPR